MELRKLIVLGLLLLTGILNAQTDFRPGYVIPVLGDTIFGQIDYRGDLLMSSICKFKDDEAKITAYYPNDIVAFRFVDSKCYVSRAVNNKKVFMEYLIKGKINIYYLRDDHGDHYYFDKEDVGLTEIPYKEEVKTVNYKPYLSKSTNHIGVLTYYLQDAPSLKSKIEAIKKPEHQNLVKLAEEYHNVVCDGEKCIIYKKKQPYIKVNLEGVAGVVNFANLEGYNNKFYFQSGVIAHLWMPRTNEKLYFKTGFLYSQPDLYGERVTDIKLISHIGYLAPKSYRIRPSFSIGLLTPSYSGGVTVNINKKIHLGVQSWANFISDPAVIFIPRKLYNYSLLGALYIEL